MGHWLICWAHPSHTHMWPQGTSAICRGASMQTTHTLLSSPLAEAGACREISNNIVHELVPVGLFRTQRELTLPCSWEEVGQDLSGHAQGEGTPVKLFASGRMEEGAHVFPDLSKRVDLQ